MSRKFEIIILFLFIIGLILFSTIVRAATYTESLNLSYVSGNVSTSMKSGWLLTPTVNFTLYRVDQWSSSGYTAVYLYDSGQTRLLDSGVCVGVTCTFSNSSNTLFTGQKYYLLGDGNGSAYTYSYNISTGFPYTLVTFSVGGTMNNGGTMNVTNEIQNWRTFYVNTTPRSNAPLLTISVNDTRTNSLVSGFTVNISNSTYSKTLTTSGTSVSITANSLNATNSSLTLALNNASFFNGSYRDTSPNAILATLNGKTLNNAVLNSTFLINSSGFYGNGLSSFSTQNQFVNAGNNSGMLFDVGDSFTISMWYYGINGSAAFPYLIAKSNASSGTGWSLYQRQSNGGFITFDYKNSSGSAVAPASKQPYNTWLYVTVTHNSTNISLWINGSIVNSVANTMTNSNIVPSPISIGGASTGSSGFQLNGSLDEVRIWNASLNQSEIQAEMNSAYPVRGANLVASYSFELNNITAGATSNWTADTNYLVNGSVNGTGAYYFNGQTNVSASGQTLGNSFSVSLWFNSAANTGTFRGIFSKGWNANNAFDIELDTTNKLRTQIKNGSGSSASVIIVTPTTNKWYHVVMVFNTTDLLQYVNGSLIGTANMPTFNSTSSTTLIGVSAGTYFNGSIADVRVYARALSAAEVLDLYNGVDLGTGVYNLSFTGVGSDKYFNFTAQNVNWSSQGQDGAGNTVIYGQDWSNYINFTLSNVVNSTNLTSFQVDVDNGSNHFTSTTTTSSLIIYNLIGNLTINYTAIMGSTYYNVTSLALNNFNQSNYNYTNTTYQALLNISTYQLFTNNSISQFNVTNNLVKNSSPVNNYAIIPSNNGTNNIQIDVPGNYTQNYTCTVSTPLTTAYCNATGIYDNQFTIGGNASGTSVNTFMVNVTNSTLGGQLYSTSTTNGSIVFNLLQGYYYNFYMNPPAYSISNVTIPANSSTNRYNFTILQQNAFELGFYNETTDTRLNNVNITIELISDDYANNYTTSNGTLLVTLLTPGTYTIRYWDDPSVPREYYVTLTNQSYNNITLYVLDAGISQFYLPVINNEFTSAVSDATVELLRYYVGTNTYKIVEMAKTDTNGQAVVRVVPNTIAYKLFVQKGSTTMTTAPTKFTSTTNTYTLSFSQSILTSFAAMPSVTKSLVYNNATQTYTFSWSDTNNLITSGCLIVTEYNSTGTYQVQNTCSNGAIGSIIYTITNTNNTQYSAIGTLETNTQFSTYTFGPVEVTFDTTPQAIFGLVGFIILLLVLLTVGFLANDIGADATIFSVIGVLLLLGMVNVIGYLWSNYVGMFIIGFILLYKIYR